MYLIDITNITMLKINGEITFPIECIKMNETVRNLIEDVVGMGSVEEFQDFLEEQAELDPEYVYPIPLPGTWDTKVL